MEKENYSKQYKMAVMAVLAQTVMGFIFVGVVFYDMSAGMTLFGTGFGDASQFPLIRSVLWGISGALALVYVLLQYGLYTISDGKDMVLLKFWVRQLHRGHRSTALALLLIPSSLGEATVLLSFVIYLLGGKTPADFLPGIALGLAELVLARPRISVRDKLIFLDKAVD